MTGRHSNQAELPDRAFKRCKNSLIFEFQKIISTKTGHINISPDSPGYNSKSIGIQATC